MDSNIDAARQKRLFDLAGEQPLAADLAQRFVLHHVAGDLDHHHLERRLGQPERRPQPVTRLIGLRQRKRRAAGANLQRSGGGGHILCHARSLSRALCP